MSKNETRKVSPCKGDSRLKNLIRRVAKECEWAELHSFPSC
ncbi:MAG: hypothetical protein N3D12_06320 [Candidatus Methanomethyliaceae archaeon]|nr:hypothetical protein [Candidatus Methanomethyliaceae archaeon]